MVVTAGHRDAGSTAPRVESKESRPCGPAREAQRPKIDAGDRHLFPVCVYRVYRLGLVYVSGDSLHKT